MEAARECTVPEFKKLDVHYTYGAMFAKIETIELENMCEAKKGSYCRR